MTFEIYVSELNGYLRAFDRICGRSYIFGVKHIEIKELIDQEIRTYFDIWNKNRGKMILYKGCSVIDYHALIKEIDKIIFNKFLSDKDKYCKGYLSYLSSTFFEDIQEFFGLISTTINRGGIFYPLRKSPVYLLNVSCDDFEKAVFFSVKIEHILLITYLYKNKSRLGRGNGIASVTPPTPPDMRSSASGS